VKALDVVSHQTDATLPLRNVPLEGAFPLGRGLVPIANKSKRTRFFADRGKIRIRGNLDAPLRDNEPVDRDGPTLPSTAMMFTFSTRGNEADTVPALFHPLFIGPLGQSIPAVVCLAYLAKLWWAREMYGVQQAVFVVWFMTALAIQLASRDPWTWIAGFVGQIALAIVLVLKNQVDDIL
jgi:hypothetical protein